MKPHPSTMTLTVRALILLIGLVILAAAIAGWAMTTAPGTARPVPQNAPSTQEVERLRRHVQALAAEIGPRNHDHADGYAKARELLSAELARMGYEVKTHAYATPRGEAINLEATSLGTSASEELVLLGAHYDSFHLTPGADDNASGVAVLLELARRAKAQPHKQTLRFVLFANEEPPHFKREAMGSLAYARHARARGDRIRVMFSLEMLGFFTDAQDSQHYPSLLGWFYPSVGDFVAFVSSWQWRHQTRAAISAFRAAKALPSEVFTGPTWVPGIDYSDHWSFWQVGYPAVMITDTSFFRTPHYHKLTDTPETLDFERMARVTEGIWQMIQ